jgi:hypothetical protein
LFQCKDDDHDPEGPPGNESNAKSITAFAFQALTPVATGTINEAAKAITLTVPYGTNVTALVPTIAISAEATIAPVSGAAQNFTNPVQYTVTAEDDSQQTYTVTVTVGERPIETCRPTVVAGIEIWSHMLITYGGTGDQLQEIIYTDSSLSSDPHMYTAMYEYTNNRPTLLEYYNSDDELKEYVTLEYGENEVIEIHYVDVDEEIFYKETRIHYHLEDGRITHWEYYTGDATTGPSDEYIYDAQGNITRMNSYLSDGTLYGYELYEYDDTPNVYKQTGAAGSSYRFFTMMNLSTNNITRVSYYFWGEEDIGPLLEFTYDEYDRPLTRQAHLSNVVITYEYECP